MSLTVTETINILADIRSLRLQFDDMISKYNEIVSTVDRLEYFLSHFDDLTNEDDLPL